MSLPVYRGPFKAAQAERLLWRAGFGPKKGDPARLAKLGLTGAVHSLTRPGASKLVGPAPHDDKGRPLAPYDAWGHDHLWWLDRMVRTTTPLVERMTLIWHDWFATSNDGVSSAKLMLDQNKMFRANALGSFSDLLVKVTKDPAMLIWLSGLDSSAEAPNENYGRELMELFTLGADRAGGYTEQDVRDQARALTGWRADWSDTSGGFVNFRFDTRRHDKTTKSIFGKKGAYDWQDSCRLVLQHPNHPSFFVKKLWSYFVPTAPDASTQAGLEKLYVDGKHAVAPVVEAILRHPAFYTSPPMVKPPVVYTAGILRALGRGIDTEDWVWLCTQAGQLLFYPPNVAGWDDSRWLDTAKFRGRWNIANYAMMPSSLDPEKRVKVPSDPVKLYKAAIGATAVSAETRQLALAFVRRALADAGEDWEKKAYPQMVFNALRQLVAVSPDQQAA
ncbi:MAG: hypothetical protein QOE91_832 [Gaiellaceae bacterium]|nr:hypothetical protein [Gaiellaceae bacterium]